MTMTSIAMSVIMRKKWSFYRKIYTVSDTWTTYCLDIIITPHHNFAT